MGGGGLVAAAEAVVYLGYLRRVKQAREQGKKVVEVKEIMRTWIIGEDDNEKSQIALSGPVQRMRTSYEDENPSRSKSTANLQAVFVWTDVENITRPRKARSGCPI